MRAARGIALAAVLAPVVALATGPAAAQSAATDYRDEFLDHFERSSAKVTQLAEAMPEELYRWSPGPGVMSVARVYAHIARYNYLYLDGSLGIDAPDAIDLDTVEEEMASTADRAEIRALLERSIEHVRSRVAALTEERLTAPTRLYGRQVAGWAVLFQLLAHMNEHVGQSVAYARMNGIVPPWSR